MIIVNHVFYFRTVAVTEYHQLSGLKTTELYFLTVLEARSPKRRHWQG